MRIRVSVSGIIPGDVKKRWCYGAQSHRACGTAAELVVVPERLALDLPEGASPALLEQAASLGIPGN